jgi:hypothetical protein
MSITKLQDVGVKVADSAAAGSIAAATWINLTEVHLIVQIIAGVVAIIAGLSAAAYHIYRLRKLYLSTEKINGTADETE